MIDSYTLNWAEQKLIITFDDETFKEYTQADVGSYLTDYPERSADVIAMGWSIPEGWMPPEPVVVEDPVEVQE